MFEVQHSWSYFEQVSIPKLCYLLQVSSVINYQVAPWQILKQGFA